MTMVKLNNRPAGRNFDNLFNDLFSTFPAAWGNNWKEDSLNFPPVNIHETKDAFHLEMNVPGRSKEDFKISVENGLLSIGFEEKQENKEEDYKTLRREFSFRSFKRSFQVEDTINVENIQARYENGLLKLLLPKKEQVKDNNKQIVVQ
jgi:HSP20 family protein